MSESSISCFLISFGDLKLYIREIIESEKPLDKDQANNIKEMLKEISKWMLSLKRMLLYQDYVDSLAQYPTIQAQFPHYQTFLNNTIKRCSQECRYMLLLEKFRLTLNYVHTEEIVDRNHVRDSLQVITQYLLGYRQLVEFLRISLDSFQLGVNNNLKEDSKNILVDIIKCFLSRIKSLVRQDDNFGNLLMLKSFIPCQLTHYDKCTKTLLSDVDMRLSIIRQSEEDKVFRRYLEEKEMRDMATKIDEAFGDPEDIFYNPEFMINSQL